MLTTGGCLFLLYVIVVLIRKAGGVRKVGFLSGRLSRSVYTASFPEVVCGICRPQPVSVYSHRFFCCVSQGGGVGRSFPKWLVVYVGPSR